MLAENQTGGSSQALCAVCRRSLPLTRLGLIRVHGPVGDRCAGSRNPPIQTPDLMSPVSTLNPSRPIQKILKKFPRASRHLAASKLATILDEVVKDNSAASWDRLVRFLSAAFVPLGGEGAVEAWPPSPTN